MKRVAMQPCFAADLFVSLLEHESVAFSNHGRISEEMKMPETKIKYDQEGDILYVSFGRSEHVTGVELADNILLRLDTGKAEAASPKAIGLTFISFSKMQEYFRDKLPLANLRRLPEDLWQAVINVVATPPVSDFLSIGFSMSPQFPPLPERLAA